MTYKLPQLARLLVTELTVRETEALVKKVLNHQKNQKLKK